MSKKSLGQFKIRVPIFVEMGKNKKKKYYLNLNLLRNRVAHLNNNIKKEFHREIVASLPKDTYFEQFKVHYTLYLPNKLKRDVANVCSIIDKNFCDVLVSEGIVPEDNYYHLQEITYKLGGYDHKSVGYCDVIVTEVDDNKEM